MAEIKGSPKGELDDKRLRLPGVKIVDNCPGCHKKVTFDFGCDDYLNYPVMNKPFEFNCYHSHTGDMEDSEWTVKVELKVSLVLVEA